MTEGLTPVTVPDLGEIASRERVELTAVPFHPQQDYQCGPAALATVLGDSGIDVAVAGLVDEVYLPGRRGSLQVELLAAARRHGRLPYLLPGTLSAVVAEIEAGRPVLVLQNLALSRPKWHYAVVVGYDAEGEDIVLRSGTRERKVMSVRRFMWTWQRDGAWAMVALRPGDMPAEPVFERYRDAAAALEATGGVEDASRAWQAAVRQWPDQPLAWLGLGNARYAAADAAAAETAYRRSLALDPGSAAARNNLARVLVDRHCPAAALELLEPAIADLPDESPLLAAMIDTRSAARAMADDGVETRSCSDPPLHTSPRGATGLPASRDFAAGAANWSASAPIRNLEPQRESVR